MFEEAEQRKGLARAGVEQLPIYVRIPNLVYG